MGIKEIKKKIEKGKRFLGLDERSREKRYNLELQRIGQEREKIKKSLILERQRTTLQKERNQLERLRNPQTGNNNYWSSSSLGNPFATNTPNKKKKQPESVFGWSFGR